MRRRRSAYVRACDDERWWQDLQPGHAASSVGDEDDEHYAAMLWLPNPDTRRGWELHGVDKPRRDDPEKPIGFGR